MAKIIKYQILSEVNIGAMDEPNIQRTFIPVEIECRTQTAYDANYPIAEAEAVPSTIEVSGEFDPEPEDTDTGDVVTWAALNAAYQEGVDSV